MIGLTFVPKGGCVVSVIGKFLNSDKFMCIINNVVPIVLTTSEIREIMRCSNNGKIS